jgi:hypothetical protein
MTLASRSFTAFLGAAALLGGCASVSPARAPSTVDPTPELEAITQQLADAFAPGDLTPWERYTDPAFVVVTEDNQVETRAEYLASLKPLPPGFQGTVRVTAFRASTFEGVTVSTYVLEENESVFGQIVHGHFRVTDVWRRTPAGFRLVASQSFALLRDPPRIALTEAALDAYAGTYELAPTTRARVRREADHLVAERDGRPAQPFVPELVDVFFTPGRTRTRRIFQRDASGRITGFVDRREGEDIAWRRVRDE